MKNKRKLKNEQMNLEENIANNDFKEFEIDADEEHPENVFEDIRHYIAMKRVPLLQKKALYLLEVSGLSVKQVAKRLNITPKEVIRLKEKAITNFKKNLLNKNNDL